MTKTITFPSDIPKALAQEVSSNPRIRSKLSPQALMLLTLASMAPGPEFLPTFKKPKLKGPPPLEPDPLEPPPDPSHL